jgi:peptide/nickel transport system substrate-binding protein
MTLEARGDVRVHYAFKASAERVFDAWLSAEKAAAWLFASLGESVTRAEIDPRVGGLFRFVTNRAGQEIEHAGEYLEIQRPHRLAFTIRSPGSDHVEWITVDIEPLGAGCILTLTNERISPDEELEKAVLRRTFIKTAAATALPLTAIAQSKAKRLRYVPQADLSVLDPTVSTSGVTEEHAYNVFDTLYGLDSKALPQPQMAEGHTVSDDGRIWLIRLRKDLWFHDGTPVRAVDCAASLTRWMVNDPFGQILARYLDAWDATDDRTLRARLKKPFPRLISALAKSITPPFMMPERLAKTNPSKPITEMVGSGPYRFLAGEFISGAHVGYRKFDRYVPRDDPPDRYAGGKHAWFDHISWRIIADPGTTANALRTGEVDWWDSAMPDLVPALSKDPNIRVSPTFGLYAIMRFNSLQPPFNNAKLRRAVLSAVDEDDFMRPVMGTGPGAYQTCYAMFPCGMPHVRELAAPLMKGPRDLDRAREAVQASGYAGERVVIINPSDYPSLYPQGLVAADLFKKLGMNVDLQNMDWSTLLQRRESKQPVERGGWSILFTASGVNGKEPPFNRLIRGQGLDGFPGWYENPEIERLCDEWLTANTDAELDRIYDAIQESALESPPFVPLGQYSWQTAYRSDLIGVQAGMANRPWTVQRDD